MAEKPEDLNLPLSVIGRILQEGLPANTSVSKEAKVAISKAASVFVLYATSCCNSVASKNKRKTISAQDVFSAMADMEFDSFIEPLKEFYEAFKENKNTKKENAKKKKSVGKDESTPKRNTDNEVIDIADNDEEMDTS